MLGTLIFTKHNLCNWENYNQDVDLLKNEILKKKIASKPFTVLSIFNSLSLQKITAEISVKDKFKNFNLSKKINIENKNKKIRLGYYSADFRKHAMSYLLAKMFELHDKSKFEIFAFSFGQN